MVLDQGGEKYILVYNGELYNTPELHAQLAALGHRFVSHSDTEVLLHAFAQWGPDCLEKLNGIFAFAVWQQRAQKLFLARDRIGVKPLFYALRGDSLIFASELKTLLCHPEIPPQHYSFSAARFRAQPGQRRFSSSEDATTGAGLRTPE